MHLLTFYLFIHSNNFIEHLLHERQIVLRSWVIRINKPDSNIFQEFIIEKEQRT